MYFSAESNLPLNHVRKASPALASLQLQRDVSNRALEDCRIQLLIHVVCVISLSPMFRQRQAYKANTGGKTVKRSKERDPMKRQALTLKKTRGWASQDWYKEDE